MSSRKRWLGLGLGLGLSGLLVACGSSGGGGNVPASSSSAAAQNSSAVSSNGAQSSVSQSSASQSSAGAHSSASGSASSWPLQAPADPARVKWGFFLDSAVANIGYRTPSLSGYTDAQGRFEYQEGEAIEFHIGDLVLPQVQAQATLTPLEWSDNADPEHPVALNIARLLQSLDEDGNPDNGITLSASAAALATPVNFDQSPEAFGSDTAVINLVANAGAPSGELVSAAAALAHLQTTLAQSVRDRVVVSADGSGNTYELIDLALAGTGSVVESPVCDYNTDSFGRRITDVHDSFLGVPVFAFHILRDVDGDRCLPHITDRQRMEIKTYNQSPQKYLAYEGEIHTYRWKFKLDSGFQPSGSFTHIFQIKPQGGSDESLPILTFTPRLASPDRFEVSFNPSNNVGNSPIRVAQPDLSAFKGEWIDAYVRIYNHDQGRAEVILTRLRDGAVLVDWADNNIDMWRAGANFNRPKWGIYRSLNNPGVLRDETVWFNDFCIAKGTNRCPAP